MLFSHLPQLLLLLHLPYIHGPRRVLLRRRGTNHHIRLAWRRNGAGMGYALQRWPRPLQALFQPLSSHSVGEIRSISFRRKYSKVISLFRNTFATLFSGTQLTPLGGSTICYLNPILCSVVQHLRSHVQYGFRTLLNSMYEFPSRAMDNVAVLHPLPCDVPWCVYHTCNTRDI